MHYQRQLLSKAYVQRGSYSSLPKEMTLMAKETILDFKNSTKKCCTAGFDGVEITCRHGYLFQPVSMHPQITRRDEYGGSIENKAYLLEDL
jgi:N-ethylmaleimide reductase